MILVTMFESYYCLINRPDNNFKKGLYSFELIYSSR